jgi:hypothetical protein
MMTLNFYSARATTARLGAIAVLVYAMGIATPATGQAAGELPLERRCGQAWIVA